MRMRETYIDHIDNIRRIDGYVSYEDYLNMPAVKELAEERGITLPTIRKREPEVAAETPAPEKNDGKKKVAVAIGTILSAILVAWCVLSVVLHVEIAGFVLFDNGFWKEQGSTMGLLIAAGVLTLAFGVIVRPATWKKEKMSAAVAAVSGTTLGILIAIGILHVVKTGGVRADVAVAIVLAAAICGVSFALIPKKTEKKNGKTEKKR